MKKAIILYFLIIGLIFFNISCENAEDIIEEIKVIRVTGKIVSEETGEPIEGIEVKFEDTENNNVFSTETAGDGSFTLEIEAEGGMAKGFLKINFDMRKGYIPVLVVDSSSVYEVTLRADDEEYKIKVDLIKKWGSKYNPDNFIWGEYIEAYRGRWYGGVNQVWVKQPEKWIVYDPNHVLDEYGDPKNNTVFNNIMEGFRAIEEYTNGFIKAPSKDDVEIRESGGDTDNSIFFEITDGDAWAADWINDNDEIYRSGAGAGPKDALERGAPAGELCASVQGGDNESWLSTVFDGDPMNNIDRSWGKLNYRKREPGSRLLVDFVSPFGILTETRLLKKILQ